MKTVKSKGTRSVADQIRQALGHVTMSWAPSLYLDTGIPELNTVLGHKDYGLPYGRFIEVSGLESKGKSAAALAIAALAQHNNAHVVWGDLETSFGSDWAIRRGLAPCLTCKGTGRLPDKGYKHCPNCADGGHPCGACAGVGLVDKKPCRDCLGSGETCSLGMDVNKFTLIQPYVGRFGKEKVARLITGEELLTECEQAVTLISQTFDRQVLVIDSIPAILPEEEAETGLVDYTQRTEQQLPKLLGRTMRRWVGLAVSKNILIIFINQLREKPRKSYGSPWYTPGGNAPRFYCHVRVRVHGVEGSKVIKAGKLVGIRGAMKAFKNKVGGMENAMVGFTLNFNGPMEFYPYVKKDDDD